MKLMLFSLLFSIQLSAFGVKLYRQDGIAKTYSAEANLADVYTQEKEALYSILPKQLELSEASLRISDVFQRQNKADIAAFHKNTLAIRGEDIDVNSAFLALAHNPVAGHNPLQFYNESNETGFCFGRALFVEKMLEKRVPAASLRKVFIIGELSDGHVIWDYHVATMFIDQSGKKYMIDTLFDEVFELDTWYKKMSKYTINPKNPLFRIYFAEASKFQARAGTFQSSDVFNPIYSNYFFDLLIWL